MQATNKTSNTLCSKAWTDLNIRFGSNQLRHCCKAKSQKFPDELTTDFFNNNPDIIQRRQDLINGIENNQCQSCWNSYKSTGTSYREHRNQWHSVADISHELQHIEIMLDNLCDMSCIYCTEHSSHKIAQEKGLSSRVQSPNVEHYSVFLDWLATLDYEYNLSFLGGELTYSKNFYNFLDALVNDSRFNNKKIYLSLMTNGNTNATQLDKLFELYNSIPDSWNFLMVFSNEATHELSELVRWGLDWNLYADNFERYLSYSKVKTIGLCPTLSLFTVKGLYDYLDWAFACIRKHNKKVLLTGNWVDGDTILSPAYSTRIDMIPQLKTLIVDNKDLFESDRWYNECLQWIDQVSKILNTKQYTQQQLDEFLHSMSIQKKSDKVYKLVDFV